MTSDPDTPPVDTSSADHISEQLDTDEVFERYEENDSPRHGESAGRRRPRAGGGSQPGVDESAAGSSDTA